MRALLLLVLAALPLQAAPSAGPDGSSKRYLIGFKPGTSASARERALKSLGASRLESFDGFDALVASVPQGETGFSALEDKAAAEPSVLAVEEDVYIDWLKDAGPASFQAAPLPSFEDVMADLPAFRSVPVEALSLPPGVDAGELPWGVARVNAPAAWAKTMGQGARVAVIDTGIDAGHPDLRGQVAGCYNAYESGGSCFDDNGHGTHVSGTIAALKDGQGVVGVAPQARLYAVKVLNKDGGANLSSIIKGLVWCAKNDIQVANMSLGAPTGSIFMRLAIKYAASKGVALVAAAGNNGKYVEYPAAYPEVIAVAAADEKGRIADFSSRGDKVEFIAPGVDVKSSVPGGGHDFHDGTSMASPHVAGLAALAVSRGANGPAAVRAALGRAAKTLPGLKSSEQGLGMIDAALLAR